uniref:Putative deoxynucleoside kinase protein n=1 Tax=Kallithea virus TaxID=1654582 RepID=A0A0F7KIN9_9VIRU|nr:putative deoxynucleoside kinase protein [Kallithea virus]
MSTTPPPPPSPSTLSPVSSSQLSCQSSQTSLMMSPLSSEPFGLAPLLKEHFSRKLPYTIVVEGNISSGKSTFLKYLEKYEDTMVLIPEPIEKWRNVNGENLLENMYNDAAAWGPSFQSYVLFTMIQSHLLDTNGVCKVMERSCHSSFHCFTKYLYDRKFIEPAKYSILKTWYDFNNSIFNLDVHLTIYIRTSPEVIYERMCKRGRSEEVNVTLEQLTRMHNIYENWLLGPNSSFKGRIILLNGDLDMDEIQNEYTRIECIINDSFSKRKETM